MDPNRIANVKKGPIEVTKSQEDKRAYACFELDNGLKLGIVSYPNVTKAAVCVTWGVGFMEDPKDISGLCHYLEHCATMGSKENKEVNGYEKFITQHGGLSNGFTTSDTVHWYFKVETDALIDGVKLFTGYLKSPLFDETAIRGEITAVDNEHQLYKFDDRYRLIQMERELSSPEHEYRKFNTGDRTTLEMIPLANGVDIQKALQDFFERHMSSHMVTVAVVGQESIEVLASRIIPILAAIPRNNKAQFRSWATHPWGQQQLQQRIDVVPITDQCSLRLIFPIMDTDTPPARPDAYVMALVNSESIGGLCHAVKRRGLITKLAAFSVKAARGFGYFGTRIDMTRKGLSKIDEILDLYFGYLKFIKQAGVEKWIQEELAKLNMLRFRFKENAEPLSLSIDIARALQQKDRAMDQILIAPYLATTFQPDAIIALLEKLTPDNFNCVVVSKEFEGKTDKIEPHYGTEYRTSRIDIERFRRAAPIDEFRLPEKNQFIPERFEIHEKDREDTNAIGEEGPIGPKLLIDQSNIRIWYKQGTEYKSPKCAIYFRLWNPTIEFDAKNISMVRLFVDLLKEAAIGLIYNAGQVDSTIEFENDGVCVAIKVCGFNDKQNVMLERVVESVRAYTVDPEMFETAQEMQQRDLADFQRRKVMDRADNYVEQILCEKMFPIEELLEATKGNNVDKFREFATAFVQNVKIEGLIYGNTTKTIATQMSGIISRLSQESTAVSTSHWTPAKRSREVMLQDGGCFTWDTENAMDANSVLQLIIQVGPDDPRTNTLADLLSSYLQEPFFNKLRTVENLGYVVFCDVRRSNRTVSLRFVLQSSTKTPDYLESRVKAFLDSMQESVHRMTINEFEALKQPLIAVRTSIPGSIVGQIDAFWERITDGSFEFQRAQSELAELERLTKENLAEFSKETMGPRRKQLCVQISSSKVERKFLKGVGALPTAQPIANTTELKTRLAFF